MKAWPQILDQRTSGAQVHWAAPDMASETGLCISNSCFLKAHVPTVWSVGATILCSWMAGEAGGTPHDWQSTWGRQEARSIYVKRRVVDVVQLGDLHISGNDPFERPRKHVPVNRGRVHAV